MSVQCSVSPLRLSLFQDQLRNAKNSRDRTYINSSEHVLWTMHLHVLYHVLNYHPQHPPIEGWGRRDAGSVGTGFPEGADSEKAAREREIEGETREREIALSHFVWTFFIFSHSDSLTFACSVFPRGVPLANTRPRPSEGPGTHPKRTGNLKVIKEISR